MADISSITVLDGTTYDIKAKSVVQELASSNENKPLLISSGTSSDSTAQISGAPKRVNEIYANPSTGKINGTIISINDHVSLQWNSTTSTLDFVFS